MSSAVMKIIRILWEKNKGGENIMKKIIGIMLILAMLISALPGTIVSAADILPFTDFESVEDGAFPTGWANNTNGGNSVVRLAQNEDGSWKELTASENGGDKVLKIHAPDNTKSRVLSPRLASGDCDFTLSFDVMFTNVQRYQMISLGGINVLRMFVAGGNMAFLRDNTYGGNVSLINGIKANQWYNIKLMVKVNDTEKNIRAFVDGAYVCEGTLFRNTNYGIDFLNFQTNEGEGAATIYVDDVHAIETEDGDGYISEVNYDFSEAVKNTNGSFGQDTGVKGIVDTSFSNIDVATGYAGKAKGDKSLYIHTEAGTIPSNQGLDIYLTMPFANVTALSGGKLSEGDTQEISMNFAFAQNNGVIKLVAKAYSEDEGGDGKLGDLVTLYPDGYLHFNGTKYSIPNLKVEAGIWYNLKLALTAGDNNSDDKNKASLYINDTAVFENIDFAITTRGTGNTYAERAKFLGVKELWFDHYLKGFSNSDGTYPAIGYYFDDVKVKNFVKKDYIHNAVAVSHTDNTIDRFVNSANVIFASDDMKVEDLAALTVSGGSIKAIRDTGGNSVTTGSAAGKVIELLSDDCYTRYISSVADDDSEKVFDMGSDSTVIGNGYSGDWTWMYFDSKAANSSKVPGVAGKTADDKVLKIQTSSDSDFINLAFQRDTYRKYAMLYKPVTVEYMAYLEGETAALDMLLYFNNESSGTKAAPMASLRDGAFSSGGGKGVYFNKNTWNRVAITAYPGKDYVTVYLNGNVVSDIDTPNKMYYAYAPTMLRFIALCGIDDAIYVDDVKVYSGTYSGGTAPFVVTQDEELATVDGEKYEIEILGDELDVSSLGDYISCDGAYTVYTDSSLSDVVVGKMTNGNVLIVKKDGLYNYYTLKIANRLIADAGKFIVDPYEMTITVPDIITTKALIENITLSDTGNSIKVYDGDNEAIDVKVSDAMVLRIITSDGEYDFAIITAPSYKLSYTSGGFSPNTDVFNATVVAELKDLFNMNYKPVMIIAGYDANGLKSVKFTQDTDWKDGVLTMSYTPDEAVTDVQIMVWDNLSNITPIMCKELKYAENLISTPVNIYLVGDSICQKYSTTYYPQQGYGEFVGNYFVEGVTVNNRGASGRSTKTFINEGKWDAITDVLKKGDYVFLCMGHNDMSSAERGTTIDEYKDFLRRYITETRAKDASIILITPITMMRDSTNSLLERSQAMIDVANEQNVTLLDVNGETYKEFCDMGYEIARDTYFLSDAYLDACVANGKITQEQRNTIFGGEDGQDLIHVNEDGADYIASKIAELLSETTNPLKVLLK